jgi:membrane associated rhomboid family serine protease
MAFLQETPQPFFRVPLIVPLLIALLVGIELSREFIWEAATNHVYYGYGFVPALYSHSYLASHHYVSPTWIEWLRPFVTYIFLHGSFTHVAINSIWLLAFGAVVARRYGAGLFLAFFLLCGIAGAVMHLACDWGSDAPVVGASAAIAGLMGAAFRLIGPRPGVEAETPLPLFSSRILLWSAIWIAINIAAGLTGLGAGPGVHLIAWQAHIGGYLAGLLLVDPFEMLTRRLRPPNEEPAF